MVKSTKDGEQMSFFHMRAPKALLERAKDKAGYIPLSVIVRKLIEKWIAGEIELDLSKKA